MVDHPATTTRWNWANLSPALLALLGVIAGAGVSTFGDLRKEASQEQAAFSHEQLDRAAKIESDLRKFWEAVNDASTTAEVIAEEQCQKNILRPDLEAKFEMETRVVDNAFSQLKGEPVDIVTIYFPRHYPEFLTLRRNILEVWTNIVQSHQVSDKCAASKKLDQMDDRLAGLADKMQNFVETLVHPYLPGE